MLTEGKDLKISLLHKLFLKESIEISFLGFFFFVWSNHSTYFSDMFQPIVITVVLLGYFLEKTAAPFFPCRILRMKTSFYCQQCDVFQGKELMTGHDSLQEGKTSLFQRTKRQADCLFSVWGYFLKPKDTWCDCHILAVMET